MRGGALPLAAWGGLLVMLLVANWVWTNDTIQVATFGFAAGLILAGGLLLAATSRGEATRPGPPSASGEPQAISRSSLGAAGAGFAVATIALGLAFGRFLVFFGAGLLVTALARVVAERREERRAVAARRAM